MKVVVTEAAFDDMRHISRTIGDDNPARAVTFVEELHTCCLKLAHMPRAFPLLPGHEEAGIRRRAYGEYLIFYRLAGDRVEVLHVVHGARDYERILFPDS